MISSASQTGHPVLFPLLVFGVPVVVALVTFWLSTRARRETSYAVKAQASAFSEARKVYESALAELRRQVAELRAENARLRSSPGKEP